MLSLPRMNPTNDGKLAYAVSRSERLTALLPADELEPLLALHARATRLAAEAADAPAEAANAEAEVLEALRSGEDVDVADVLARMAHAGAITAAHQQALRFFAALPGKAHQEIRRLITDSEDDLYSGLSDQLTAVLDEAEAVLLDLGTATTAEAAMDAGVIDSFIKFRALADAYASIRDAHRSLLTASGNEQVTGSRQALGVAYFRRILQALPTFADKPEPGLLRGTTAASAPTGFDALDTGSREHFVYIVRNRSALEPHVGNPDDVTEAHVIADDSAAVPMVRDPRTGELVPSGRLEPGRSQQWHGSEVNLMAATFGDRGSSPSTSDYVRAHTDN